MMYPAAGVTWENYPHVSIWNFDFIIITVITANVLWIRYYSLFFSFYVLSLTWNWYFWTVVLEKTLDSPLDCKEIKPVNPKGNQSWIFIGRTDAEALILWPPDVKNWLIEKTLMLGKIEGRWRREQEDEMVGWHHQFYAHELEQAPGVSDGQRSLACFSSWGCKKSDTTEWLNWTYPGRKVWETWDLEKLIYLLKIIQQVNLCCQDLQQVDFFHAFLPYKGGNSYFFLSRQITSSPTFKSNHSSASRILSNSCATKDTEELHSYSILIILCFSITGFLIA